MYNSYGSSMWLNPFSHHCRSDNIQWKWKRFFEGKEGDRHKYHCEEKESHSGWPNWPTHLINIEVPTYPGFNLLSLYVLSYSLWKFQFAPKMNKRLMKHIQNMERLSRNARVNYVLRLHWTPPVLQRLHQKIILLVSVSRTSYTLDLVNTHHSLVNHG